MASRKSRPRKAPSGAGHDVIYGTHAVAAALANPARRCLRLWATANAAHRLGGKLAGHTVETQIVAGEALNRKAGPGAVHQGLLLEAAPLTPLSLTDLPDRGIVVALDQVSDPHNIGAVMRSCAAFGAIGLIVTERHAPAATGTLIKAASGAFEHVPLVRLANLARALKTLSGRGFEVIGLDGDAELDLARAGPGDALCLVLGAEGRGLRRLTRETCHRLARLRTTGPLASLNVSNAAAVALYLCSASDPCRGGDQ